MEEAKELVSTVPQNEVAPTSVWTDTAKFNQLARVADMISKTSIIPMQYQGKPGDCLIATEMATRIGVSPLMVMQNLSVIKGKPSWNGQACKALIDQSGRFTNVHHVYTGTPHTDSWGCYLTATRKSDGERINGTEVTIAMAKAEGWTSNAKWRNIPEQMLAYRAAAFFARVHCPDILMGIQTSDEVYETVESNERPGKAKSLTDALKEE